MTAIAGFWSFDRAPSGRKLERRAPYSLDIERVIEAAARTGTMLEINSNPDRRDLNDIHARAAAAAGVPIVINTDAHRTAGFAVARYGIATARRAWLTAAQVVNTQPWDAVEALRPRHRSTRSPRRRPRAGASPARG